MQIIKWKKGLFGSTYNFESADGNRGIMKSKSLSGNADLYFGNLNLFFEHKGIINERAIISDKSTGSRIGEIAFDSWKARAYIKWEDGRKQSVRFINPWQTEWAVEENDQIEAYGYASLTKGRIESDETDLCEVFSAFYAVNRIWENEMILIVCFLPIFITLIIS
jgi:hypothetical protein